MLLSLCLAHAAWGTCTAGQLSSCGLRRRRLMPALPCPTDRPHLGRARQAQQHAAEQRAAGGGHGAHEDGAEGVHHPVPGGLQRLEQRHHAAPCDAGAEGVPGRRGQGSSVPWRAPALPACLPAVDALLRACTWLPVPAFPPMAPSPVLLRSPLPCVVRRWTPPCPARLWCPPSWTRASRSLRGRTTLRCTCAHRRGCWSPPCWAARPSLRALWALARWRGQQGP